ncbi:SPOR domain-containing protein [Flagellimonas meridianipacifica]|uniref:Sporulation related protein n=1 Tax=Flagellimonas meridianipacifica TaxID=1080225 RepID=A0A2T0MHF9_9FLAO|nr:SPOR domain-containing protein [Allomuricauda pacifica]PRX56995.1 sporulation related protein [Allomuricauda pacifica]
MRIEGYISSLLFDYNCVIVPGFGAFLAHTKSAEIDSSSNRLIPPLKTVSFNSQLTTNDGVLVSHIAKEKKLDYDSLLGEIESVGQDWKDRMSNGEQIELFGVGKLWLSAGGKIQFQPENKTNYLTSSFGMASVSAIPIQREILKEEVEELENNIPFIITPEKRESTSFRPWLSYAAVILLMISAGFTGFRAYEGFQNKQVVAQEEAQKVVSQRIQEATFFSGKPIELPSVNLTLNKKSQGKHHVVAGAFRIEENAEKKVAQLKKKGYNARYLGVNKYGLHQVCYSSFEDPKEALTFLRKIRNTESRDAWLLSEK